MTTHPHHSRPAELPPRKLAASLSIAACLALVASPAVRAQTSPTPASNDEPVMLDEFVVESGIRASLEKGLEIKRVSFQVVDSIVAEDIGKFPDNNLVESLQRVSGVQVTNRGAGEVASVSIRGLGDVTTTINGRTIFTASGRSVALADIPASLLGRVDVFKTRSADLIETGIAGQIDIHSRKPFDFEDRRVVLAARGIYQDQADKIGPNVSALYSDRWENDAGKFGLLFNVAFARTDYRDQSVTAGAMVPFMTNQPAAGWTPYERIFLTDGRVAENPIWQAGLESGLPFAAGSTLTINGQQVPYVLSRDAIFASDFTGSRERPAANAVFQFAPSNDATYTFEAFYNGYRNEMFNNLLFSFADWWGGLSANPGADIELFPGTNIVKSRQNVGFPYMFTSGDATKQETDSFMYAFNAEWDINPDFKLTGDLAYQTSEFNTEFIAMRTDRVAPKINVDFNSGGGLPAFNFPDDPATTAVDESDLTNANLWNIAQLYDNANRAKGDAVTGSLDGEYKVDWNIINKLSFGGRYDMRSASEASRTQDSPNLNQNLSNYPDLWHVNEGFFDGRSAVPTTWVVPNGPAMAADADTWRRLYKSTVAPNFDVGSDLRLVESFNVDEDTAALYLQADFLTYLGNHRLDGQLGFRYVDVQTDMEFTDQDTLARSSASASTSKLLPSFTLRYAITDNLRLRFNYGETLRRPGFNQLNPLINYVEDVTNIGYGTATGGNPNLKPTESTNYDLSLEWYFTPTSAIYGTAFKREIEGFVVDFRKRVRYEDYDYILTQPDNASNGELEGFEFGLVYFPDNLPDPLKGFGVQASYTILDSQQDIPITNDAGVVVGTDTTPLFGVSDTSYSVVLAYEKPRFSLRLSYVWREDFLNNYEAALFANPLGIYRKPEQSMDAQLSINVTDTFSITIDATNLTEEIYQSYYEYPETHNFGSSIYSRTFAVGARYSF